MKTGPFVDDAFLHTARKPASRRGLRWAVAVLLLFIFILPSFDSSMPYGFDGSLLMWWRSLGETRSSPGTTLSSPDYFDWSSLQAEKSLNFHSCYDGFECAKLKLPLDYFNGTYPGETISLALAKLPAKVSVDDPRYGGPILINPGGPGGSGVMTATSIGKGLQSLVDPVESPCVREGPTSAKYYDIIGFDPRGIGFTKPLARCMPDGASAWSWTLRQAGQGALDSSDAALGRVWSMEHAFGESCRQAMNRGIDAENKPDIKQYMTTASVARDMLELVEQHADYVAHRIADLTKEKSGFLAAISAKAHVHVTRKPKLQYWGFSYGTYLGSTFSSMFPDRVGRVVLDGVVNSDDYNDSLGGAELTDAEKAMDVFYSYCVRAGDCPLATPESSEEDIRNRTQKIIRSLYHSPLAVNSADGPEIISYSDIKALIFTSLYSPTASFPVVADILAAVEQGNGTVLDSFANAIRPAHIYSCPLNGTGPADFYSDVPLEAILCSDGDSKSEDIARFEKYWHELMGMAPSIASLWAVIRIKCNSWKIRAVHRFQGAFGGITSEPILWISNTADPVTPLRSGRIMSERFPGSALLVQDSAGHCSISQPTPCTLAHIRSYFQTGATPPPGTLCIPPSSPFDLNTTHPDSSFYSPSLAASIFPSLAGVDGEAGGHHSSSSGSAADDGEHEEASRELGRKQHDALYQQAQDLYAEGMHSQDFMCAMHAAGDLQRWAAEQAWFWGAGGDWARERTARLMKAARSGF